MARHETLAAVDLGSNSFHLEIGRVVDRQIYPLDAVREVVRLGGGLTADKRIDRATQAAALDALRKFAERLRGFPRQGVRAVGTNALRVAKNASQFLREARAVLGFPIEVISGREEARLIYLGVAHALPVSAERRLVVDIGGGSTEFIIGTGLEERSWRLAVAESLSGGDIARMLMDAPGAARWFVGAVVLPSADADALEREGRRLGGDVLLVTPHGKDTSELRATAPGRRRVCMPGSGRSPA